MRLNEDDDRSFLEVLGLGEVRKEGRVLGESHAESVDEEERPILFEPVARGGPASGHADEVTSVLVLDFAESVQLGRAYNSRASAQY
jgi:hypothetical protein